MTNDARGLPAVQPEPAPSTPCNHHLLVFLVEGRRYALPLSSVDRVIRAVEVTPLPAAPAIVHGAINVHGRLLPVVNVRKRFGLPEREVDCDDCFLLARTERHTLALVVDAPEGVIEHAPADRLATSEAFTDRAMFPGLIGLEDGLVLIHDLEKCLSLDEERELHSALHRLPADVT